MGAEIPPAALTLPAIIRQFLGKLSAPFERGGGVFFRFSERAETTAAKKYGERFRAVWHGVFIFPREGRY